MLSPVKLWRRQKEVKEKLNHSGKILSWTKIYITSKNFKKQVPYYVVLVELENKERLIGQLVDDDNKTIRIGMKVISVLRRLRRGGREGVVIYGLKFKRL